MQADVSKQKNIMLKYIISFMSDRLSSSVSNYLFAYPDICEIRIRLDTPLAFTISEGNLITGLTCTRDDIRDIIDKMTFGDYLKNEEIMRQGFISLKYGIRVGICGEVFVSGGAVKLLRKINYINIRIPSRYTVDCSILCEHIIKSEFSSSVLIFSPPCHGKTTYLRSIINALSSEPYKKRICAIDTNNELYCKKNDENPSFCEYLSGYPKPYGIELAFRYMNPEYVVCDELVGMEESNELLLTQHTGIPLIATTHADSYSSLLLKKNILPLLENGIFDNVLRIKKEGKGFFYELKRVTEL